MQIQSPGFGVAGVEPEEGRQQAQGLGGLESVGLQAQAQRIGIEAAILAGL